MDRDTVTVYERRAREWIERRGERTDGLGRALREEVGAGLVADLGCGAGRYLRELGHPAVGLDASASMLGLARRSGVPLVRGELESLPFADGCLAAAFARHSYLHLRKAAMPVALGEVRRVLRPGGLLLATLIEGVYEGRALPGDDFAGRYFALWQPEEIAAAVREAGMTEVSVEPLTRGGEHRDLLVRARR